MNKRGKKNRVKQKIIQERLIILIHSKSFLGKSTQVTGLVHGTTENRHRNSSTSYNTRLNIPCITYL